MRVPVLEIPAVFHIGTLDQSLRGKHHRTSQEGAGLSVSLCPEGWVGIASLGGSPLHELSRDGALFLDVLGMDDATRNGLASWAEERGLARREARWLAWRWDDEDERWRGMVCHTREEALGELEDDLDGDDPDEERLRVAEEDGGPPGGSLLSEEPALVLTEEGDRRAHGFGRSGDATDMVAMFFAEDVLRAELPDLVGVWWRETYDPVALSAPRGAILPCCVGEFAAREIGWDSVAEDEELLDSMPEPTEVFVSSPGSGRGPGR